VLRYRPRHPSDRIGRPRPPLHPGAVGSGLAVSTVFAVFYRCSRRSTRQKARRTGIFPRSPPPINGRKRSLNGTKAAPQPRPAAWRKIGEGLIGHGELLSCKPNDQEFTRSGLTHLLWAMAPPREGQKPALYRGPMPIMRPPGARHSRAARVSTRRAE